LIAQTSNSPRLLKYLPICDKNVDYENHYRINNRIVNQTINNQTLTVELDIYGNCAIEDTSWIDYRNDTLLITTGPIKEKVNDKLVIISEAECDCYFHLFYEIQNIKILPQTILFNNKRLVLSDNKYLPEEHKEINGEKYLIYDSTGKFFEYEFYNNGKLKKIRKEYGQIFEVYQFNEYEELIEIYFDSRAVENGSRKTIKIK